MTYSERIEAHGNMTKCIVVIFACYFMCMVLIEINDIYAVPFLAGFITATCAFFYYAHKFNAAK